MTTVDKDQIKENKEKLDSIVLFPGTLKELNRCRKTKDSGKHYEMQREYAIKLEIYDYNNLMSEYLAPDIIFKNCLYNEGFKGAVTYSERYIQGERSLHVICEGIAISEKERWWKKYFKRDNNVQ